MKKKIAMNKAYWCLLAFFSQAAILAIIIISGQLSFLLNDDTTLVSLAGGGFGSPSQYVIQMHIVIGYLLKWLFTLCIDINWVTVLFLFIYLAAAAVLDAAFAVSNTNKVFYFYAVVIVDLAFTFAISCFTFTVVSYWAGMAGLLALTAANYQQKKKERVMLCLAGGFVLVLGAFVRTETLISLLIVYLAVVISAWILDKNKRPAIVMICVTCLFFAATYTNRWMVSMDPVQKEYIQWNRLRAAALDCEIFPYSEELSAQGMSAAQYSMICGAFYYDRDIINEDVFQLLIDMNGPQNRYNFDVVGFIKSHFSLKDNVFALKSNVRYYNYFYRTLFAAVLLFHFICGGKRNRLFLLLIWLMTVGTEFVFYFIQRSPYRVVMPNYLMAALFIVWYCRLNQDLLDRLAAQGISISKIALTFTVFLGVLGGVERILYYDVSEPKIYSEGRQEVLDYLEGHSEQLFLAGDARVFDIYLSRSVWDHCGRHNGQNLVGGWDSFSVPYLEVLENHGIEDPYHILREAINNPDILLLTTFGDVFPDQFTWIPILIQEQYGITAHFERVDNISAIDGEAWATYKLVCS